MSAKKFAMRLASLIPSGTSERAFARQIGISIGGLRGLLHEGNSPTLDTLNAIAAACGVSVNWLATGEDVQAQSEPRSERRPVLDGDLMGRVIDVIERVYGDVGVRLPRIELGRLAAEKYDEIAKDAEDAEEWPALLDLLGKRLKRSLLASAADPTNVKRGA